MGIPRGGRMLPRPFLARTLRTRKRARHRWVAGAWWCGWGSRVAAREASYGVPASLSTLVEPTVVVEPPLSV